jgi:Uma2 family endonuclease
MAQTEPKNRRWTRTEYFRLADLGFFDQQRVELIWGRVVQMPPMRNEHAISISLTEDRLRIVFGITFWIRVQMPLNLFKSSAPEPDLAVVSGTPRDYQEHPDTAVLLVETSDTTLRLDRTGKAALYAAAEIPEYWIVNLADRQLEVFRDPLPNNTRPRKSRYGQKLVLKPGEEVSPLAAPNSFIKVDDLLP